MERSKRSGAVRRTRRALGALLAVGIVLPLLPGGLAPVPVAHAQASFNYAEALQKAIFFYEEQISGPKPSWSRVTWRGDSALDDGDDAGRDLTGGWFDAGDHVKFGFAMASSATMLAWGGVEYRAAFESKGQLPHLLNNLRFVNDYFIKAHPSPNELWGHVGDAGSDHSFWGSAEVMHLKTVRPSFRISLDGCNKGSDLVAETAAAMAASSIVFRPTDPAYANTLVTHARQLFSFAQAIHPSYYVDCMPGAPYYNSRDGGTTGPNDEMAWAAVWLHRATGEAAFLTQARQLYATMCKESQSSTPCFTWTQSWNDKHFGTYVLMAKLTGEQRSTRMPSAGSTTGRWAGHAPGRADVRALLRLAALRHEHRLHRPDLRGPADSDQQPLPALSRFRQAAGGLRAGREPAELELHGRLRRQPATEPASPHRSRHLAQQPDGRAQPQPPHPLRRHGGGAERPRRFRLAGQP